MEPQSLKVKVGEDTVTALLYLAPKKTKRNFTLILGHGAGGNQLSPFMRTFAAELAERGVDTVTFNFIYSEKGKGGPDPKPKLEACYLAVIEAVLAQRKLQGNRLAVGGKSMGGRIGSQVVAALETGELSFGYQDGKTKASTNKVSKSQQISGLVFLGYPLHPPGRPEQLRDAHLKHVTAPMLFIQGTKDPFASPEELRAVIKKHRLPATLHLIEGGDHSFKVPKTAGLSQAAVHESVIDFLTKWIVQSG